LKKVLTDRYLKSLKPAPAGQRYDVMDGTVPGLGVRVSDKGRCAFILIARYPGFRHPARRALGLYGAMTLEAARAKARLWLDMVERGIDPAAVVERAKLEAIKKQGNTFGAVMEDWIRDKLAHERQGKDVERDMRKNFLSVWAERPIADITDLDVLSIINVKKRTAPVSARNLLSNLKRFFSWTINQRVYRLPASPCERLKLTDIIGRKVHRDRTLTDDEIFAFWCCVGRMPYPYGPIYRLLILTGLRLNEVAKAGRSEIDRRAGIWTVPAERMKGRNGEARAHAVPLTPEIVAEFDSLKQFKAGPYLFSTTFGEKPFEMNSWVKNQLDAQMLVVLRELAVHRGEDPAAIELRPWVNHDLRRTVRTHLSRLRIPEEAREAVLAHARPGMKAVYDHHDFLDEKREALELWAARLRSIVEPIKPPTNVVPLRA
jgi:integrase